MSFSFFPPQRVSVQLCVCGGVIFIVLINGFYCTPTMCSPNYFSFFCKGFLWGCALHVHGVSPALSLFLPVSFPFSQLSFSFFLLSSNICNYFYCTYCIYKVRHDDLASFSIFFGFGFAFVVVFFPVYYYYLFPFSHNSFSYAPLNGHLLRALGIC